MRSVHLDDEQIQRLLHGELVPGTESAVRRHAAECAECRERVARAERDEAEVYALLREVDHAVPRIDAGSVAQRAGARRPSWLKWAAGIVLALGLAGAAYAVPGSPLAAFVRGLIDRPAQTPDSAAAVGGIAVTPGAELVVEFMSRQTAGAAELSLSDGRDVVVRAVSGAARFTAGADRLEIDNRGSVATFEIQIPRTAPRVEILVGSTRVFLKLGDQISAATCRSVTPVRFVCPL
jgi:anti-sigma factor RsiW